MACIQAAAIKTTVEFSAASTLHGLQYIFESGKNLSLSKVIWLLVVVGAIGFGIIWSYEERYDYSKSYQKYLHNISLV